MVSRRLWFFPKLLLPSYIVFMSRVELGMRAMKPGYGQSDMSTWSVFGLRPVNFHFWTSCFIFALFVTEIHPFSLIARDHTTCLHHIISIFSITFLDYVRSTYISLTPTFSMAYSSWNGSQYKTVQGEDGDLLCGLPHDRCDSTVDCTSPSNVSNHPNTNPPTGQEPLHIDM